MTLRLTYISINGGLAPGGTFTTMAEIREHVPTAARGITSYWQARVSDESGVIVMIGFRAGYNGTGDNWAWRVPMAGEL